MEEFIIYNSLNFYSLILLAVIFLQARKFLKDNDNFHSKIWLECIVILFFIISGDIVSWLYLSLSGNFIFLVSVISNCIIYTAMCILTSKISLFLDYSIKFSKNNYNYFKKVFFPLIVINAVFALLSIPFGFYYTYDAGGNYVLGSLYPIYLILVFLPLFIELLRIIFVHKDIKQIRNTLVLGIILPVFFLIIHLFIEIPFTTFFAALTLSVIIMNALLINNNLNIDFLTGLKNRRGIDKYFSHLPQSLSNYFTVIYFDLNGFKAINDRYGHKEGDAALTNFAKILKKVIRLDDLLARHGGDEFMIAMQLNSENEHIKIMDRLNLELEEYNLKELKPYKLSLSYGVCITKPYEQIDKEKIIEKADYEMYKNKPLKYNE